MKALMNRALLLTSVLCFPTLMKPASLNTGTLQAWAEYIHSVTLQIEQRSASRRGFLWVDDVPERLAKLHSGQVVVSASASQVPKPVADGLIHDWTGAVFIPNVKLTDVLSVVRDYPRYKDLYRPCVKDSKILESRASVTGETSDRFWLLLVNKSLFIKTAFDIDFASSYTPLDAHEGYATSRSTRVQQIEEYGAQTQRVLPEGQGDGIIWRLFSATHFLERDGGVYLELEIIGLSRDIPASIRWLVEPIARRVSHTTLSLSLRETEKAVQLHAQTAGGSVKTSMR
jgi:hypothetical protein